MIDRVKERFDLQPRRLAGDTVYGAVRLFKWLVDRQRDDVLRPGVDNLHTPGRFLFGTRNEARTRAELKFRLKPCAAA
jgi:hypothetical protein